MTIQEAEQFKSIAEYEISKTLSELMAKTGCRITGVSLTTEEVFGIIPEIITNVEIKLQIK